jgi:hypothetical protein
VGTLHPQTIWGLGGALEHTPPTPQTYHRHALVLTPQF